MTSLEDDATMTSLGDDAVGILNQEEEEPRHPQDAHDGALNEQTTDAPKEAVATGFADTKLSPSPSPSPAPAPVVASTAANAEPGLNTPTIRGYNRHDKQQVSHRGQYAIERFLALLEYSERVSTLRALAVCIATPLPALAIALLLQCTSIGAPVGVNWMPEPSFWVIDAILMVIFAISAAAQARSLMARKTGALATLPLILIPTAASIGAHYVVASGSWFPVPFTFLLGALPFLGAWVMLLTCISIAARKKAHPAAPAQNQTAQGMPVIRLLGVFITQVVMILVFAIFTAILVHLRDTGRDLAMNLTFLLYQSLRNFLKHTLACFLLRHAQDRVPEMVVFTVELFTTWYLCFVLATAFEQDATITVLVTMALSAIIALATLYPRLSALQRASTIAGLPPPSDGRLAAMKSLAEALKDPDHLDEAVLCHLRLGATGGHSGSSERRAILDHLATRAVFRPVPPTSISSGKRGASGWLSKSSSVSVVTPTAVRQASLRPSVVGKSDASEAQSLAATNRTVALQQTLIVLFNTEYLILVKYVEILAPALYLAFLALLNATKLPNYVSVPHMMAFSVDWLREGLIVHVALMLLLQLVLACVLTGVLRAKNLGVTPLRQLAFVLEAHQVQIQFKLIAWLLFSVFFMMPHFGSDFTLEFGWRALYT